LLTEKVVRNRAKELVELLSDVEKIRAERRKAKANRNKYVGVGNDGKFGGMSFNSGGSRYGGFGSDSLAGNSYGNGKRGMSFPNTDTTASRLLCFKLSTNWWLPGFQQPETI